jgi:DNA-binding transcriptional regulator GbsR (MarR family)
MSKTAFSDSFFHIVHTSINYMKKQELINLQRLSAAIGLFIRYWGFRKIHGEIWSVVYLSPKALSGVEIGKTLKVSKALVSRALKELEAEGLIFQTESENSKTKRYAAEEDVAKIIQGVLKRREIPMINKIQQQHTALSLLAKDNETLNLERLQKVGLMIQMAQMGLGTLLDMNQS